MTKDDLMQVYYIDKEISSWKRELDAMTSRSRFAGRNEKDSAKAVETERKITRKLAELEAAKEKIIDFIMNIDDCQTRLIFMLRCLNMLSWNAVADEVGGMNSEDSVKKRFYRYLEKCG